MTAEWIGVLGGAFGGGALAHFFQWMKSRTEAPNTTLAQLYAFTLQLQESQTRMQSALEQRDLRIDLLQDEIRALQSERDHLKMALEEAKELYEEATRELEAAMEECQELRRELQALRGAEDITSNKKTDVWKQPMKGNF